jgi:uncharacterized membrane protein
MGVGFQRIAVSIIFAIILCCSFSLAATLSYYSAEYDISGNEATVRLLIKPLQATKVLTLTIPGDAYEVGASKDFELNKYSTYQEMTFYNVTTEIEVTYVSSSFLEQTSDNLFILDFSTVQAKNLSILLKLPEEAKLKYSLNSSKPSIMPATKDILTDGRRIIIRWTQKDFTTSQALLVIYETPKSNAAWIIGIGATLILVIIILSALHVMPYIKKEKIPKIKQYLVAEPKKTPKKTNGHHTKKREEEENLTRNLFEEEKLIIKILLVQPMKELWQKQLEIKTGLNKVKLSRKLRSLEAKGLIEKIPYGNTNKIRIKKN